MSFFGGRGLSGKMDFAKAKIFLIILVISLFAPDMILATPLTPPEIPVLFYGALTIDNQAAPVGTKVSIHKKSDNLEIASATTAKQSDKYFLEVPCKNYIGEMMVFRINNLITQERQCVDVMTVPSVKLDLNLDITKTSGGSIPLWLLQQQQLKPVVTPSKEEAPIAPAPQLLGEKIYADGALIRGKDKKIYLIANNKLVVIRTLAQLREYQGQPIYDVSDLVIRHYMTFADGDLLRGPNKRIYVLNKGKRQPILTLTELRKKYFKKEIFDVADLTLAKYPEK